MTRHLVELQMAYQLERTRITQHILSVKKQAASSVLNLPVNKIYVNLLSKVNNLMNLVLEWSVH